MNQESATIEQLSTLQKQIIAKRLMMARKPEVKKQSQFFAIHDEQNRFEPFPLTEIQEAYWIGRNVGLELGNIGSHGYIEIETDNLNVQRLNHAWNVLIRRHDMLRAVFSSDGKQRVLSNPGEFTITEIDLRSMSEEQKEMRYEVIRSEMSHQVFDPESWPLFDVRVLHRSKEMSVVIFSIDVLIFDAHSFDILSDELEKIYNEPDSMLPSLQITFRDYILAIKNRNSDAIKDKDVAYWEKRAQELPFAPMLPLAKHPKEIKSPRFSRRSFKLEAHQWKKFREISGEFGVTPSNALLLAYGKILQRWSTNESCTINITLFNRQPIHEQVKSIVGDFTAIMLVEVPDNNRESFSEQVLRIQKQLWTDLEHSSVSGIDVLRMINKIHGTNSSLMPIVFTSAITSGRSGESKAAMSWLGKQIYSITQTPQVWIDFQITEDSGCLVCDWDVVDELFPPMMVDEMFASLRELITSLTCCETWVNSSFNLLSGSFDKIIKDTNSDAGPIPKELLHDGFLRNAIAKPESIAVRSVLNALSYKQLYQISNHLANELIASGMKPGDTVVIIMDKGWEQIAAVLGALEAGGIYVPVDSGYPIDRIAQIVDACGSRYAICKQSFESNLRWLKQCSVVSVKPSSQYGSYLPKPISACRKPEDIAYIIFTSGSTGVPKGVVISHVGAVNTIIDVNEKYEVSDTSSVLTLSSLSFDLSVYDIFGLYRAGGTVIVPSADLLREPAHWHELLKKFNITLWNTVPALMEMLVSYMEEMDERPVESLQIVMMSGDWIPVDLTGRIKKMFPKAQIHSLGGATEGSIWSICFPIRQVELWWKSIPYGKAMKNQAMYVLNNNLEICPAWVTGDIYISGTGVAIGYWKDEKKTAESFIIHPVTKERIYKTGDLGRYFPDGNIEFLGRKDTQVKVNGFRVELGEIESVFCQHSLVKQAAVVLVGDSDKDKRLISAVVLHDKQSENNGGPHNGDEEYDVDVENEKLEGFDFITDKIERLKFRMQRHAIRTVKNSAGSIAFPEICNSEELEQLYLKRISQRIFSKKQVPLQNLLDLLSVLLPIEVNGVTKYRYGSAGSLYPVQTYLYVKTSGVDTCDAGLYYLNPINRSLDVVFKGEILSAGHFSYQNRTTFEDGKFVVFLVGNISSIAPLYGKYSEQFCLLEAGLISQLMETECRNRNIGLCQIGAFEFDKIRDYFSFDANCKPLIAIVGGLIPDSSDGQGDNLSNESQVEKDQAQICSEILEFAGRKLPKYMVPKSIHFLNALPLTGNGKVDRKSLAKISKKLSETPVRGKEMPKSQIEKQIAEIWCEVLELESVGLNDNFFDLGGTSVKMVNAYNKISKVIARKIGLVEMFFNNPTIASLSAFLVKNTSIEDIAQPVAKRQIGGDRQNRMNARLSARGNLPNTSDGSSKKI